MNPAQGPKKEYPESWEKNQGERCPGRQGKRKFPPEKRVKRTKCCCKRSNSLNHWFKVNILSLGLEYIGPFKDNNLDFHQLFPLQAPLNENLKCTYDNTVQTIVTEEKQTSVNKTISKYENEGKGGMEV